MPGLLNFGQCGQPAYCGGDQRWASFASRRPDALPIDTPRDSQAILCSLEHMCKTGQVSF